MKILLSLITFTALLSAVFSFGLRAQSDRAPSSPGNPHVDYAGYARTVQDMAATRDQRLIDESQWLSFAAEPGTVILDARSAERYAQRHIEGAVNLPYTEFTAAALAQVIPQPDSRVLIYCNNNFDGDPLAFARKVATTSLNLATYAALTDYGYSNVWELAPYTDVAATTLPMVGTLPPVMPSAKSGAVTVRLDLDRQVLPVGRTETAIVKVSVFGKTLARRDRAPVNLAIVIDRSGSMSGDKLYHAREAAIAAVRRLSEDDTVSIIAYNNQARVLLPASRVGDGRRVENTISEISAGGGTNLYGGVELGASQVRRYIEENYVHRVILLSDGLANVGPSSPSALARLGADLVQEGISVTTVGLGLDFNEDLMTRLAMRSDGNTYFVEHSNDLPRIFDEELGDVLNVVARRVIVQIDFPAGVRPIRVVGREGRLSGGQVEVELNQLYGGHEKFALVEVEIDPVASAGTKQHMAHASARYEDVQDGANGETEAVLTATFSDSEQRVLASANHELQADYARNRLAEVKDEVVELSDRGEREEAAAKLRSVSSFLGSFSARYGNKAVAEMAAPAAAAADRVEAEGLSNEARKDYRASNAQTVRQQRTN